MNNLPQDITQKLEHIQPIADDNFQNALEDRLIADWYRQYPKTKRKPKKRVNIPLTFVASVLIVVLAGVVIMSIPLRSSVEYLAPQSFALPTPLPTLQPVPAYIPSDLSLILEPDMVAISLSINLETPDDTFKEGDVVDILATLNHEQLDTGIEDLLETQQVDDLTIRLAGSAKIINVQNESSIVIFQVSQQDAVVLTWLIDSHIPITLRRA